MLPSWSWGIEFESQNEKKYNAHPKPSRGKGPRISTTHFKRHFEYALEALVSVFKPQYALCPPPRTIRWDLLPASVCVEGGYVPVSRVWRKCIQVNNMVAPVHALLCHLLKASKFSQNFKVVEFCAGSGFVALPLAVMFPSVQFVLLDAKEKSLDIAAERIKRAGLDNVSIVMSKIEDYTEKFDVGIALHACGAATDISLEKCIQSRAAFVMCSCCIGKITTYRVRPLSRQFQDILDETLYSKLIQAADFGHSDIVCSASQLDTSRRLSKVLVEEDRVLYAKSEGYEGGEHVMVSTGASPKNDMIIGWPVDEASRFSDFDKAESPVTGVCSPCSFLKLPADVKSCSTCCGRLGIGQFG